MLCPGDAPGDTDISDMVFNFVDTVFMFKAYYWKT